MLAVTIGTLWFLFRIAVLVMMRSSADFATLWASAIFGNMAISLAFEALNRWSKVLFDGVTGEAKEDALGHRAVRTKHKDNASRGSWFDSPILHAKVGNLSLHGRYSGVEKVLEECNVGILKRHILNFS